MESSWKSTVKNKFIQFSTALLIALISFGGLKWVENSDPVEPHGLFLSSTPIALNKIDTESVTLYKTLPPFAKTVGLVNVMMKFDGLSPVIEEKIINYAAELCSKNGADGLIIKDFFASKNQGSMSVYFLRGLAIKK